MIPDVSRAGPGGRSSANERREQFFGVVDPHKGYAVLVGAVEHVAKLDFHGSVGSALVDDIFAGSGSRQPPASQNTIGVGRAVVDLELDIPGGAGIFLLFDNRNHGRLRYRRDTISSAWAPMVELAGLSNCFDLVHRCRVWARQTRSSRRPSK